MVVLLGAVLIVVLLVGIGVIRGWSGWLPELRNPFAEQTTDRSQPVVLRSIQDLSRFTAASGNFEVVIDVERDRRFVPDFLFGERTLFVAAGTVDAYVEFGGLAEDALVVDEASSTVQVTLPAPQLAEPNLDLERSYVFAEERGVVNRVQDFFDNDPEQVQQVMGLAEERIGEAAGASGLLERAEENTRKLLEGMLGSLGFETVTVTFQAP
ncbi:MAG TPA: DUF4230 domain-containing protein [Natronosporangium sp.]